MWRTVHVQRLACDHATPKPDIVEPSDSKFQGSAPHAKGTRLHFPHGDSLPYLLEG